MTREFNPIRLYELTDYANSLSNPRVLERQWMNEQERDQTQLQIDPTSCLVWEQVVDEPMRLTVEEVVRAVCSYYFCAGAERFAEAVGDSRKDLYLRFSELATLLGDFEIEALEQVVNAYGALVDAEAKVTELADDVRGAVEKAEVVQDSQDSAKSAVF